MNYDQVYKQFSKDINKRVKYSTSGIYAIFAVLGEEDSQSENRKLLYIGKSKNMLQRIATHYTHIKFPYSKESEQHKYQIMRLLHKCGYPIAFDVLEYTTIPLLDQKEGEWIRKLEPPLNYQIPKPDGGWKTNRKAKTITVKELLQ